jgi:hypothetical protein
MKTGDPNETGASKTFRPNKSFCQFLAGLKLSIQFLKSRIDRKIVFRNQP